MIRAGQPVVRMAAAMLVFSATHPLAAQSKEPRSDITHSLSFSIPLSQVENWERIVARIAAGDHGQGNAWQMYQSELTGYFLLTVGPSDWRTRVGDGFVGAPGRPTDSMFVSLREVRYDVTQHAAWRVMADWGTRDDIDPAAYPSITIHRYRTKPEMRPAVDSLFGAQARLLLEMDYPHPVRGFIEDERRQDVMVIVFDSAGPGGFMNETGSAGRWQTLMRDIARVITAHTTARGRFVPELSVPVSR